jgi:hypothetical protein
MMFRAWVGRLTSAMTSASGRRPPSAGRTLLPGDAVVNRTVRAHAANLDDAIALIHESDSAPTFGAVKPQIGPARPGAEI